VIVGSDLYVFDSVSGQKLTDHRSVRQVDRRAWVVRSVWPLSASPADHDDRAIAPALGHWHVQIARPKRNHPLKLMTFLIRDRHLQLIPIPSEDYRFAIKSDVD